ncbi:alpha/beta hydrolase [Granulicella sp. WH15]|nr:alpha/beta hydrolase [Granulicella sp. WH15]
MPQAQLADVVIHFETAGEGAPLLLLPGALGTGRSDFSDQIDWFGQHYRVIAPDLRGYGQSRPPKRDFPLGFYPRDAEEMYQLMSGLGFARFAVMGWSDGANVGTLMALQHPESVTQLVVWGGNSFLSAEELHVFQSIRSLSTWSSRAIEPLAEVYGDELQSLWDKYVKGLEDLYASGGDIYRSRLGDIRCPTLILHGEIDPIVPSMHPEILRREIVGSEYFGFPEGKHNIHKRYAELFNQLVLSFLKRTKVD